MKQLYITALIFLISASFVSALGSKENIEIGRFDYSGVAELEIVGDVFSVEIQGSERDGVNAVFYAPNKHEYQVKYAKEGDTLKIWCEKYPRFNAGSPKMVLQVPARINVTAGSLSGDISISGINTDETLDVSVLSGAITLKECESDLECSSASGNILIDSLIGDIKAETLSGRIEFASTKGQIEIGTVSGDILGNRVLVTDDSDFETVSGGIDIDFVNPLSDLSFDLSTLSGRLSVGDSASNRGKLNIQGGSIKITGKTFSGGQEYK